MGTPTPDRDVARRRAEEDEEAFTGSFSKKTPPKKTAVSDRWNHYTFKSVLAGVSQIRLETQNAVSEIDASVKSAKEQFEQAVSQKEKVAIDGIQALLQDAIDNINEAQALAIAKIEKSKAQEHAATTPVISTQSQSPSESSFEQIFVNQIKDAIGDSHDELVISENESRRVDGDNIEFRSVILQRNSTLIVSPTTDRITLRTLRFVAEKDSRIVARGEAGKNGTNGARGDDGSTCGIGFNGERGGQGGHGESGTSVKIDAVELVVADTLTIDTSGGAGGNGGQGGNGGNGGAANNPQGCGGGTGGAGGVGGSAGNGGDGGSLEIRFVRAYSPEGNQVTLPSVRARIEHTAAPGTAGLPGGAGPGGFGGSGIPGKSLASGDRGIDGSLGQSGNPGTRGSTTVASVTASDR